VVRISPIAFATEKSYNGHSQLIGPPGVGKTAILEGLASRIVAKEVPEVLYQRESFLFNFAY
jgi:ATP-dependent Clp protease ATP-binding subunit ClpA